MDGGVIEKSKPLEEPNASDDDDGFWFNERGLPQFTLFYHEVLDKDWLQENFPIVASNLDKDDISCTLNLVEGSMTVSATKFSCDPDIFGSACAIIELLSRHVQPDVAMKVLDCCCQYYIIKIGDQEDGGICTIFGLSKEQFLARRKLLMGSVLKDLGRVTACDIVLFGTTIAVIGSLEGIKIARSIVEDCMAYEMPPAPRVRSLKKKIQANKTKRTKMTGQVMMNLEALRV